MGLARSFEQRLQIDDENDSKGTPRAFTIGAAVAFSNMPHQPLPSTSSAPTRPAPRLGARFTRLTSQETAQRCIDNLCFNCPEKFTPGDIDTCTMKGIYLMELDE